jgi:dTDP-4-dehydrorhamnose reductase
LITGGAGFVGGHLIPLVCAHMETYVGWHTTSLRSPPSCHLVELDVTDEDEVNGTVCAIAPHVVIHAAAVANVRRCEQDPRMARQVNVTGARNVAQAAQEAGARLIYLSTDLVHDGQGSFYTEVDRAAPVCEYGRTKLDGEVLAASLCRNHCIVRSSLTYGISRNDTHCFAEEILGSLRRGREVRLFRDEFRSLIYVANLCDVLAELAGRDDLQGLFNICGPERLSRLDFGLRLAEVFGLNKALLVPVTADQSASNDARRPRDCSMSNAKAAAVLKTRFLSVDEGLRRMLAADREFRREP